MERRAKIIGTLGPSSQSVGVLEELIKAGLNVARINMAHGPQDDHARLIANVRKASANVGREVAVLIDLQGPKIRVDSLDRPLELKPGEEWAIGAARHGGPFKDRFIPTTYDQLVDDCHNGARVLFDDGLIHAKAVEREGEVYKLDVVSGGTLKGNKGINLPDCEVSAPGFTDKDRGDLFFGLKHEVDYVALSFLRKKEDVLKVKALLHKLKKNLPVVAKIEKAQAVENLDGILELADVVMIARGDMGVEIGNHLVPSIQKSIISKCNASYKPVITATQMLESMTEDPTPTRAEASDVANAVWDGTDAVMLSAETAVGVHPVEVVKMMGKIIKEAERSPKERPLLREVDLSNVHVAIMAAASIVAEKVQAEKVLSITESGNSCLNISTFRPSIPVLGVTNSITTSRKVALFWGVEPFYVPDYNRDDSDFQRDVINQVKKAHDLQNGDKLVITRGDGQFFSSESSNSIKVHRISGRREPSRDGAALEEIKDQEKRIVLDTNLCTSCHNCVHTCPHDIWVVSDDGKRRTALNEDQVGACTLDMACVESCPTGAISIFPDPKP